MSVMMALISQVALENNNDGTSHSIPKYLRQILHNVACIVMCKYKRLAEHIQRIENTFR
jgi:hypothetical protein